MKPSIRVGHGYDCHRLAHPPEGGPLVLGGLHVEHEMGPVAHSDGDAYSMRSQMPFSVRWDLMTWGHSFRTMIPGGVASRPIIF